MKCKQLFLESHCRSHILLPAQLCNYVLENSISFFPCTWFRLPSVFATSPVFSIRYISRKAQDRAENTFSSPPIGISALQIEGNCSFVSLRGLGCICCQCASATVGQVCFKSSLRSWLLIRWVFIPCRYSRGGPHIRKADQFTKRQPHIRFSTYHQPKPSVPNRPRLLIKFSPSSLMQIKLRIYWLTARFSVSKPPM